MLDLARLSTIAAALFLTALSPLGEPAASVRSYLLEKLEKMKAASEDFVKNSDAYAALINANGGSPEGAYKADPREMDMLVTWMQANYKAMDSFGYETIEGIVAGIPSLSQTSST